MNGLIALLGSGEYLPVMDDVDRYLLTNCGANGRRPRVVCLPTGAGREGDESINRWSSMGIEHFTRLNADVQAVPVIDKDSANDPQWATALEKADVIYFSGGNPQHIHESLQGSLAWDAANKAWANGAVYAGCSAGAMILGSQIPDFRMAALRTISAFGVMPARFIMPHFDAIPRVWKPFLMGLRGRLKAGETMLGIDEDTALVGKLNGTWTVMGKSQVHVFTKDEKTSYKAGEEVKI
jgi:cyanophycinase-like exopeptidase